MYSKSFFAFIAISTAGLMLLAFLQLSPPKGGNYELVLTPQQFMNYAREQCAKAARPRAGISLPAPTEMLGDGKTYAQINWRPGREVPDPVNCRFEKGKGVTDLKIDGKSYGPVGVDGEKPPAPAPESAEEKHWGHW